MVEGAIAPYLAFLALGKPCKEVQREDHQEMVLARGGCMEDRPIVILEFAIH